MRVFRKSSILLLLLFTSASHAGSGGRQVDPVVQQSIIDQLIDIVMQEPVMQGKKD